MLNPRPPIPVVRDSLRLSGKPAESWELLTFPFAKLSTFVGIFTQFRRLPAPIGGRHLPIGERPNVGYLDFRTQYDILF